MATTGRNGSRPADIRFLAEVVRQLSVLTRSERILSATGLTHEEAVLEVDSLLWDGVCLPLSARCRVQSAQASCDRAMTASPPAGIDEGE
jgi:hypothetical protein